MEIEDCIVTAGAERLVATKILARAGHRPTVVAFHGTGKNASRVRVRYLLEFLAREGVSSVCVDFSGHGDSTGASSDATLVKRVEQAKAACELLGDGPPRAFIGTSMGAHVAAMLSQSLHPENLVMFCPAAYAEGLSETPLDDAFPSIARRAGAHHTSPALRAIEAFRGNLLVFGAREDQVIPPEVPQLYIDHARLARSREVIWVEGAGHQLHAWLQQHDEPRISVMQTIRRRVAEG